MLTRLINPVAMAALIICISGSCGNPAVAQSWQQRWGGGWLNGTCYRFPPPHRNSIGAEAAWMIQHDAQQPFVSKQALQLQALYLRCMRAAGAPE
jgi:hypothetical protein